MTDWKEMLKQFIDTCTSKRILFSGGALIMFSVLIIMVEEIAEESATTGDFDVKNMIQWNKSLESGDAKFDASCYEKEEVTVLQGCSPCSEFERKAIKSKHCLGTGYFERVRCSLSNSLSFRPCSPSPSQVSLCVFQLVSLLITILAGVVSKQRKAYLDRHAYARLSQTASN